MLEPPGTIGLVGGCSTCAVREAEREREDPRPTLQHFFLLMEGCEPWSRPDQHRREPGDLLGITFQNITIAAPSILGEPDVLWGFQGGEIRDLVFENLVIGGEKIEGTEHFYTNEFVR